MTKTALTLSQYPHQFSILVLELLPPVPLDAFLLTLHTSRTSSF
jgi:hypothetical protein